MSSQSSVPSSGSSDCDHSRRNHRRRGPPLRKKRPFDSGGSPGRARVTQTISIQSNVDAVSSIQDNISSLVASVSPPNISQSPTGTLQSFYPQYRKSQLVTTWFTQYQSPWYPSIDQDTQWLSIHPDLYKLSSPLRWSLIGPPSSARSHRAIPYWGQFGRWASEPACPGVDQIIIDLEPLVELTNWMDKWEKLNISREGCAEITVERVLEALYRHFNQPLTKEELDLLNPIRLNLILATRYRRLGNRAPVAGEEDLLRLDGLVGFFQFGGLSLSYVVDKAVGMTLSLHKPGDWPF
ncbi:hypothetical protein C8J56DRAFT_1044602 [Mycena floridula]|nr:hypothetical protein C8J56DRAFT_1044602 [Mycena floridula]